MTNVYVMFGDKFFGCLLEHEKRTWRSTTLAIIFLVWIKDQNSVYRNTEMCMTASGMYSKEADFMNSLGLKLGLNSTTFILATNLFHKQAYAKSLFHYLISSFYSLTIGLI